MDLTALKYFTETARIGNLSKAAEKLEISPSAVHRQIKLLETELGVELYRRTHYGLALTSAGKALYDKAVKILQLSDAAVRDIKKNRYYITEPLSLAFMDDAFTDSISLLLEGFRNLNPQIKINLHSGVHKKIMDLLDKKTVDVAGNYFYQTPKNIQYIKTDIVKPFGILMRSDDKLADEIIDASVLKKIALIVPQTQEVNPARIRNLPYDTSGHNILAETDNTYSFWELVLRRQGYIFCIEPSPLHLKNTQIIFKPVYPINKVTLYFIKQEHTLHQESANAFFDYIRMSYAK